MQTDRIAELLTPFLGPAHQQSLTRDDLDHISMYIDMLLRWNSRINLTAVRGEEEIVTRHFGESLFVARHLFSRVEPDARRATLADVGSGAGFPGIPIKLWAPHLRVTLIESNHKKATFLREIVRVLTLADIDIKNARAEVLGEQKVDTVTLRAVERFESILPTAARLLKPTGRLVLMIGAAQVHTAKASLARFSWSDFAPIPDTRSSVVLIGRPTIERLRGQQ